MRLIAFVFVASIATAGFVSVTVTEDSEGDLIAVSIFGNATCAERVPGCVGASAFGNANESFVAVSGTGNASACTWGCVAASGTGDSRGLVPLSVLGSCSDGTRSSDKCFALAMSGDAHGYWIGAAIHGDADGFIAIAGYGKAVACESADTSSAVNQPCVAVSMLGDARGMNAVAGGNADATAGDAGSVWGNATATNPGNAASLFGDARGSRAVSGTGNATACDGSSLCVAASITGSARGQVAVSGCDKARQLGSDAICTDAL